MTVRAGPEEEPLLTRELKESSEAGRRPMAIPFTRIFARKL
eukprot:CAMPEP_0197555982 /NCGR_PEP_ID=MMETSP1320-20131121/14326_1 /TAXON_ID=91990 /ORGANISM="Bolidomonas sp., Strain RCC2347" /LENGTH=40 /DNA_ID= /DNA_START= /DNA_END= /DNA_ORIENTATION=